MNMNTTPPLAPRAFDRYKAEATRFRTGDKPDEVLWQELHDWWSGGGRGLFIEVFSHETGIAPNPETDANSRIGAALPKSPADFASKMADRAYYRAHAELFLIEMDHIVANAPRTHAEPDSSFAFGNILRFAGRVAFDSVVLLDDWAEHCAEVPGAYGVGKNLAEHMAAYFHGGRQIIYGHGSFGLSFMDNHSDLAVGTIRQALETRLRRAFGLIGRISTSDGSFHPVGLSDLLDVVADKRAQVVMPIPFENVRRINSWANMLMHSGRRDYAWAAPRTLYYLRPLLMGGDRVGTGWTIDSGVRVTRADFDEIRDEICRRVGSFQPPRTTPACEAVLAVPEQCSVVFI